MVTLTFNCKWLFVIINGEGINGSTDGNECIKETCWTIFGRGMADMAVTRRKEGYFIIIIPNEG